jgi:hypothetical protein
VLNFVGQKAINNFFMSSCVNEISLYISRHSFRLLMFQGTIQVPAPCQYARKLAHLVGQAVNKKPNQELEEQLYFL